MTTQLTARLLAVVSLLAGMVPFAAHAKVAGIRPTVPCGTATCFALDARADVISTSDGDSMWMWGYADASNPQSVMQYPGPTLIVNQGETVTVLLTNHLPVPVSIVFPGQVVTAFGSSGTQAGFLTQEVLPALNGTATYRFTASQPGTFTYYSGTQPDLQVEMGLVGAIVVRPSGFTASAPTAYGAGTATAYDQEYLYLVTEADPLIHNQVAAGCTTAPCNLSAVDMTSRHVVDWFVNGRNFPDTMGPASPDFNPLDQRTFPANQLLPTQPYNAAPLIHPGDKILIRWVAGGFDPHPFHTHGQNHVIVARDARLLKTAASAAVNLGISDYTTTTVPGETVDAIWGPWTGAKLGWDVYGHTDPTNTGQIGSACSRSLAPTEDVNDHCKPLPVVLPSQSELSYGVANGGMWGGTPFLGVSGDVPPINPGAHPVLNTVGGIAFMWHSHAERELTTNNVFIGGMATMALIVPYSVTVP
jgi:FtsP/CotA-like multicopper oxidase with cupredoxin domain